MMNTEKDKMLENFMEDVLQGLWTLCKFAVLPVKSSSKTEVLFENLIRTFLLCGVIILCIFIYGFVKDENYLLSSWTFIFTAVSGVLIFFIRCFWFLLFFEQPEHKRKITTKDVKSKRLNFSKLVPLLENSSASPVGVSLLTKKPVLLNVKSRLEHIIVSGATGQGKTTLLKTLFSHALRHNHPVIIIDPKGEKKDILEMKRKAWFYGRLSDFCLFSLSFPKQSVFYNPLLFGTAEQIKARLIDGLRFEHEYYKAQASLFLSGILSTFKFLNKPISFEILDKYLSDKSHVQDLKETLLVIGEKNNTADKISHILEQVQRIPREDLSGLHAQISSINCLEFRGILSGKEDKLDSSFSFEDCLKHRKIAYFQMNVNGYGEVSRQIGRMILQDLKVLSNRVQAGQRKFDYDFCACFIDEFGSFANFDFANFLKMARSAKIGIHLFCQGLSDLSQISPEFKNQVIGNTALKVLFRQDVGSEVEEWASTAGTFSSEKKTYQIVDAETEAEMTGIGSIREAKEMRIEFDVFKRLSPGQAVLIDKARHKEDLFRVWRLAL